MPTRAAILLDHAEDGHATLTGALTQAHAVTEVRSSAAHPDRRAWWLAAFRPDIVVAAANGPDALLAAAYRILFPRTRLLLRLGGPARPEGPMRRALRHFVLRQADAVLAEDAAASGDWARSGRHLVPLSGPSGLEAFLACPLPRAPGSVHRVVYAGPLTPRSGATDILSCIAAWAAQHGDHPIEIWWAGEGDLAGILDAQPLPPCMTQRFLGPLDRATLADCFGQCGILVLPLDREAGDDPAPVAEALAAGLVVVGSAQDPEVRRFVVDGVNGWVFDPHRLDRLGRAIGLALGAVSDKLAAMRAAGRERVTRLAAQSDADRLHAALSLVLPATTVQRPGLVTLQRQAAGTGMPGPQ